MATDLASAAILLAQRGIAVFPVSHGLKTPLIARSDGGHGFRDATTNLDAVRTWWTKYPRANIGAATGSKSGVWALDIDAQHGGIESLRTLEAEHGALPLTVEAATPSGGRHLYFRWRNDTPEIRNSAGRIAPGIDVRSEGGFVVVPPSVLFDGRRYTWIDNGADSFADAPAWLVTLALPPPLPARTAPKPLTGDVTRYDAAAVVAELRCLEGAGSPRRTQGDQERVTWRSPGRVCGR